MTLGQIIVWLVVGAVAGLLANAVVKGGRLGLLGAIVVGILGGFIGGWLFGLVGLHIGGGIVADIIVSFVGAVVLLYVLNLLRRA